MNPSEQRSTPETDAETMDGSFKEQGCTITLQQWDYYKAPDGEVVMAEFARKLERERDEARKHLRDANRGAQVNARINQSMAGKLNEARQQLEAMREAVVQLRDSLEVGKDSVETWDWCNTTLAKLQPFLKP